MSHFVDFNLCLGTDYRTGTLKTRAIFLKIRSSTKENQSWVSYNLGKLVLVRKIELHAYFVFGREVRR